MVGRFAENLRRIRQDAGYKNAKQFSKEIGIAYTTYINYENRNAFPSEERLCMIADKLEVSVDELLGRSLLGKDYAGKYFSLREKIKDLLEEEKNNGKH